MSLSQSKGTERQDEFLFYHCVTPSIARHAAPNMPSKVQFRLRVLRDDQIAMGPGKIDLLEAIAQTGSISAAARHFGMSYRRAWLLIDEMNRALRQPAVVTATGGNHGGGTVLTDVGRDIVRHYRSIEQTARLAAAEDLSLIHI